MVNATALNSYFQYTPSLPGNIIYLLAFILITLALSWLTWRSGPTGRVMWIVVFTGAAALLPGIDVLSYTGMLTIACKRRWHRDGRLHRTHSRQADSRAQ